MEDRMWTIDTPWFDVALFLSLFITGSVFFGHFEQHKPAWRRFLKPVILVAMLLTLTRTAGRSWAYGVFALLFAGAGSLHFWLLSQNGINGWTGEPRARYLALVRRISRPHPGLCVSVDPHVLRVFRAFGARPDAFDESADAAGAADTSASSRDGDGDSRYATHRLS
jgi:hypothetical protein